MGVATVLFLIGGGLLLGLAIVVVLGVIPDMARHHATWAALAGVGAVLGGVGRAIDPPAQDWMHWAAAACLFSAALFQWRSIRRTRAARRLSGRTAH